MKKEHLLFIALVIIASATTQTNATLPDFQNRKDTIPAVNFTDTSLIYSEVDEEPKFSRNPKDWVKFMQKNLNAAVPVNNKAPNGTYTVIIEFLVEKDGTTKDFKALTNMGYGMENECLRTLKRSGKWIPAMHNGQPVRYYRKQPITFIVSGK